MPTAQLFPRRTVKKAIKTAKCFLMTALRLGQRETQGGCPPEPREEVRKIDPIRAAKGGECVVNTA